MSEASVDVIVEVVETTDNNQFLWDLHVRWFGQDQILSGFITAGEAVNEAVKAYPGMSIRVEVIPLTAQEKVNA